MSPAAARGTALCRLEEIADGQGRGFTLGAGRERGEVVVLRQGARVVGYMNACPHLGTPLEWIADRFVSADGDHILCATHGARFRISDGVCVAGPCRGQALQPVALRLDAAGRIILA